MEENQYARVEYTPLERMNHDGIEFTFFCKRPLKAIADAICSDLISRGKQSVVTESGGEFVVWRD
jgi:hypothetical protein